MSSEETAETDEPIGPAVEIDPGPGEEGNDAPCDIEELEEVEVAGRRHLLPKALKGGFMMHADYTRKTQALAEERAALAAEREALVEAAQALAAGPDMAAPAAAEDLGVIDWEAFARANPKAAQAAWDQHQAALEHLEARHHAAVLHEGRAELARDIPDWSPGLASDMARFAQEQFGFTAQEVGEVMDPRLVKLLHQAFRGAQGERRLARLRAGQATEPAISLRGGGGGHIAANTDDFAAFERLADAKLKARR